MTVTISELARAELAFKQAPQPATCAMFLKKLREAEEAGIIGPGFFHDGLADVEAYLWRGGSVANLPDAANAPTKN